MRRVALVTGAARGIGRAIAQDLAQDHDVAITWRSTDPDALLQTGPDILAIRADLTHPDSPQSIVDQVIGRFGRLDVIVNNAGLVVATPVDEMDIAAHRSLFETNLTGPAALLSAALPHLEPGAAIVNISSINAALPPLGAVAYGASKAALNLWTRGMAKELGPKGIRVNAVAPGAINTPEKPRSKELTDAFVKETALGRPGTPEDIAKAVRFLATDQAGFITGEILAVSGGYRL
ncbi:SDR family oxidoreductase [Ruegeria sp. 2205SS24-7]|uniref:SDR family NAD(P)-dependent oxidoreductase n=1 Tax=Ruegeria discodermiae TaxID=3064389 RepID=UPI002741879D|nr:SDR family oxidoreductase [Ruegeria sp. 2205SS24-7]MDP5215870.1 SDR family oxidoreductase [Ruegeria sp. 2205SS24-7]